MTKQEFQKLCERRVVLLDGATGSNLMKAGMPKGVCTEQWILEHPAVFLELQRAYVEAGSDIVYAPTFSANRYTLAGAGLADQAGRMNRELVAISKEAVQGRAFIAGDLTTVGKVLDSAPDVTYERLLEVYKEQAEALSQAGVDLLVAETLLSVDEAMLICDAVQQVCDLPLMVSLSVQADGSAYFGGTAVEAVAALQEMGAAAVGINCSVGPDQLSAIVKGMKAESRVPVIVKPNAGMPVIDDRGNAVYTMTPEEFGQHMQVLIACGAGIVGGCCGTDPDYIRILKELCETKGA